MWVRFGLAGEQVRFGLGGEQVRWRIGLVLTYIICILIDELCNVLE